MNTLDDLIWNFLNRNSETMKTFKYIIISYTHHPLEITRFHIFLIRGGL